MRKCETENSTQEPVAAQRPERTQLSEALKSLQQTQEQLIQQERLAALGQMASGVAHDFNNVLVPILGYTDLLLTQPETLADPVRATHMLQAIHEAAQTARTAVQRLRFFYAADHHTSKHQPVSLRGLVDDAVAVTRPRWHDASAAHAIQILVQTDVPESLHVLGSGSELREALTCLIENSIDALQAEGGTIRITAAAPQAHQILLQVTDTGCGMSEEVHRHCLEPFFTTKGGHGTGLGLSMVYGITQRHGGNVKVETDIDSGTTISLSLPAASQTEAIVASESVTAQARPSPKRILVADDEAFVRDVLERFLSLDGHQVQLATDGTEAIDRFDQHPFDLVILDRAMPGLSGDQVAAAIRSTSEIPIVMLTGFGDQMIQADDIPLGVDRVISKPVTIAELRRAITETMPER